MLDNLRALLLELGKGLPLSAANIISRSATRTSTWTRSSITCALRCFVVIDLKIDEFKPEYAGKMNFYLSAVDDLLRHPAAAPTIGLILCNGRNAGIVEYALRDSTKPMGIAAYRVSPQAAQAARGRVADPGRACREFPLMALVKVRIDLERTLRQLAQKHGIFDGGPALGPMLQRLAAVRGLPPSVADLGGTLRALNAAAHGADVSADAAAAALDAGTRLLDGLRRLLEDP